MTVVSTASGDPVRSDAFHDTTQNIVTSMLYDGTGNLLTRTEASGTPEARTTTYDYDALGQQTKVISQAFGIYNQTTAAMSADVLVGAAARQEGTGYTVTNTYYDAFGNAVANVGEITMGQSAPPVSYKVYDRANRLSYEIDAKGYVTAYARDVFGESTSVTRYSQAVALGLPVPMNAATAPSSTTVSTALTSNVTDRTVGYLYDAAGRITRTTGPAGTFYDAVSATANALEYGVSHVVINVYDTFGDVVLTRDLQNATLGVYADTYNYFDAAGQNYATVDARGYATRRQFDSFGNLQKQTEFAGRKSDTWTTTSYGSDPATQPGTDRIATYVYDRLDRKTLETHTLAFESAADIANGSYANSGTQTSTSFGYDAVGNLAVTTNESGSTYMEYDALGRLRATIQPARANALDATTVSPLTEFWYDEFGERTVETTYANSATAVTDFRGVWTPGASKPGYSVIASPSDRSVMTVYDGVGHVIETDGAAWAYGTSDSRTYNSYDAMGRLAKTWHTVSGATSYSAIVYDAVGQTAISYAASSGAVASVHAVDTEYTYNAFGEVLTKGAEGTTYETYDYDNNGNLWRTNAGDGVPKVYAYDLSGRQTAAIVSDGLLPGQYDMNYFTATDVANAYAEFIGANRPLYRTTETVYDVSGNVVATVAPQRETATNGTALIAGPIGLSASTAFAKGIYTATLTATWPDLSALGSGDVRVTGVVHDYQLGFNASASFSSAAAAKGVTFQVPMSDSPMIGTASFELDKKDVNGNWQVVALALANGSALNFVGVAAPAGATSAQINYQSASMTSPVTATLTNFGNVWGMNMSNVTGVINYTLTFGYADGTTTTTALNNFTIGSGTGLASSWIYQRPVTTQSFDRWGNVVTRGDPRSANWFTDFSYDSFNRVTKEVQGVDANGNSMWSGFDNSGNIVTAAPTTRTYYDAQGREVELVDADGHRSVQKYDAGGNEIETDQGYGTADQSKNVSVFNVFGDVFEAVSGRGFSATGALLSNASDFTTLYVYDKMDDLLKTTHGTTAGGTVGVWSASGTGSNFNVVWPGTKTNLFESSSYDADGNKLSSTDAAGYTTTYTYDLNGHLLSTTLPLLAGQPAAAAAKTTYGYDDFGHQIKETDADNNTQTWTYDYFGKRLIGPNGHTDIGGHVFTYTYDNAGELLTQTSASGRNDRYTYDKAGQMTQLLQAVDATHTRQTNYAYDLAGEHLRETTAQGTSTAMVVVQDNHLSYDALGRLMDSADESVHVSYGYDAQGNLVHQSTHVILDQALSSNPTVSFLYGVDNWNAFDALNRQIQVNYQATYDQYHHVTGLSTGLTSHTLTYDADGNRASDSHYGNTVVLDHVQPQGNGVLSADVFRVGQAGVIVTDNYAYDALDRLDHSWRAGPPGVQQVLDIRGYDADGRTMMQGSGTNFWGDGLADYQGSFYKALNQGITDTSLQINYLYTVNQYDTHGQVIYNRSQTTADPTSSVFYSVTDYSNQTTGSTQTRGYDAAGDLMGDVATNYNSTNGVVNTQTTVNTLARYESYEVSTTSTKVGSSAPDVATTGYDYGGTIAAFTDPGQTTFNRSYVADLSGQVLSTTESTQVLRTLVIAGHVVAQYGVGLDALKPQNTNLTANLTQRADFGFGFRQLSGVAGGSGAYVVSAGDSLQGIAYAMYGDSGQWWLIAQANGLSGDSDLRVGQTLNIPSGTSGTHNSDSTYTPYDPNKILGDMSAHLPTPAKERCQTLSAIIGIVVAVIVTRVTDGDTEAGALAGDIARQYSLAAFNHQLNYQDLLEGGGVKKAVGRLEFANEFGLISAIDPTYGLIWSNKNRPAPEAPGYTGDHKYDFKSTAIAVGAAYAADAAGSYLSDGAEAEAAAAFESGAASSAEVPATTLVENAVETAAVANVTTQGLRIATHEQDAFSWRSFAASTAGAGVGTGVSLGLGAALSAQGVDPQLNKIVSGTVGGFSGGATTAVAQGGKWSVAEVAIDAFGNALAQSVTSASTGTTNTPRSETRDDDAAYVWHGIAQSDFILGNRLLDNEIAATQGQGVQWTFAQDTAYRTAQAQQQFMSNLGGSSSMASTSSAPQIANGLMAEAQLATTVDMTGQQNYRQLPPQQVVIVGHAMTWAESAAYDAKQWLDDQLQSTSDYWKSAEDNAVAEHNPIKYVGAHIMGLLGQSGNSLQRTAVGLFQLATSADAQLNAVRTVGSALTHPLDTAAAVYSGVQKFASLPVGDQGDALFKFGVETLATLGAGKAASLAGDVALAGAVRTVDAVGSAVDAVAGRTTWGTAERTAADLGPVGHVESVAAGAPGAAAAEFVGPGIGRSGFKTSSDFADASFQRYQTYVNDAYGAARAAEDAGLLRGNPNTRIGDFVDRDSAARFRGWLSSEGISEGSSEFVQMNRWLRDPAGTGLYARPDIRIPAAGTILDATVGMKWATDTQIARFSAFSGGDAITIVRPQQLGGSYSIWP